MFGKKTIDNIKVLVVDDHMTVRMDLEKALRGMGAKKVDQAPDVEQAMALLDDTTYNLVFVDLKMPGKPGYDLIMRCRKDKKFKDTAFIVVSAESEDHYVIEALSVGATSYIVKPVSEATVREHTTKALEWMQQKRAG